MTNYVAPETSADGDRIAAVSECHRVQHLVINDRPTLEVPAETKELRCALIEEEAAEFRTAIEAEDLVEVADAIGDLTNDRLRGTSLGGTSPERPTNEPYWDANASRR